MPNINRAIETTGYRVQATAASGLFTVPITKLFKCETKEEVYNSRLYTLGILSNILNEIEL
jgi:hypothetical protein